MTLGQLRSKINREPFLEQNCDSCQYQSERKFCFNNWYRLWGSHTNTSITQFALDLGACVGEKIISHQLESRLAHGM